MLYFISLIGLNGITGKKDYQAPHRVGYERTDAMDELQINLSKLMDIYGMTDTSNFDQFSRHIGKN